MLEMHVYNASFKCMLAGAWQGIVVEKTSMNTIVEEVDAADVAACEMTAVAQVPAAKEAELPSARMPSAMKVPLKGGHMPREQASCI